MLRTDVALRAIGLRKTFGTGPTSVTPLDGVDLELRAGQITLLTGPSGSGKTTLLQILSAFDSADAGEVHWPGGVVAPTWLDLALVAQSLALLPELTLQENVALAVRARIAESRHEAVAGALADLDLADLADRLPGEVSLGQQQRAAVARAVVGAPRVLIADEPTSHQDSHHAEAVMQVLGRAARAGSAVLVAGHDPNLATIATHVLHLADGRLREVAG
jgi:putative ABC transport system ATP-binding protein